MPGILEKPAGLDQENFGRSSERSRPNITERSDVAPRTGVEALMKQLCYEARTRGLARAQHVLVIADGAVCIWNLAEDRCKDAIRRWHLYHVNSSRWAVANELPGVGSPPARRWVKSLRNQIRHRSSLAERAVFSDVTIVTSEKHIGRWVDPQILEGNWGM